MTVNIPHLSMAGLDPANQRFSPQVWMAASRAAMESDGMALKELAVA